MKPDRSSTQMTLRRAGEWLLFRSWRLVLVVAIVVVGPLLLLGEASARTTIDAAKREQVRTADDLAHQASQLIEGKIRDIITRLEASKADALSLTESALESAVNEGRWGDAARELESIRVSLRGNVDAPWLPFLPAPFMALTPRA